MFHRSAGLLALHQNNWNFAIAKPEEKGSVISMTFFNGHGNKWEIVCTPQGETKAAFPAALHFVKFIKVKLQAHLASSLSAIIYSRPEDDDIAREPPAVYAPCLPETFIIAASENHDVIHLCVKTAGSDNPPGAARPDFRDDFSLPQDRSARIILSRQLFEQKILMTIKDHVLLYDNKVPELRTVDSGFSIDFWHAKNDIDVIFVLWTGNQMSPAADPSDKKLWKVFSSNNPTYHLKLQ